MKYIPKITAALLTLSCLISTAGCGKKTGEQTDAPTVDYTQSEELSISNEDGSDLWLRDGLIQNPPYLKSLTSIIGSVCLSESHEVIATAGEELTKSLSSMLGWTVALSENVEAGAIVIGTAENPVIAKLIDSKELSALGNEGFVLKSAEYDKKPVTVIAGGGPSGVLYGSFRLLEMIRCREDIAKLNLSDAPKIKWRVLNQWDSWDGGLGGKNYNLGSSIYKWNELPDKVDPRYAEFARANASIGINTVVVNNVNTGNNYISTEHLPKIAAVADVFRKYGIRLAISINFNAPTTLGKLNTNDPLNQGVIDWWKNKIDEIYTYVPDFAGFLIKADSEGKPGPAAYGRTHAEGANMFADLLAPHGGIIMWRAFVYGDVAGNLSSDICNQAYEFFTPQDGKFHDNVVLQIKNGPRDFLPREPVSPLFGGMKQTNTGMEIQVKQEYTGQGTDLCYLIPMWKYYLETNLMLDGADSVTTLSDVLQGKVYPMENTLIAGVANVGDIDQWCNVLLAQSNWYGFGKLAWNPDLSAEEITETWTKQTYGVDNDVVSAISTVLLGSWELYEDYTSPYAMGMTFELDTHYNPDLAYRNNNGTISVNRTGIGNNRSSTSRGNHTNATAQYSEALGALYNDIDTCPEELLCWFHHVPYDRVMSDGRTMIENLYEKFSTAPARVKAMKSAFAELEGKIDSARLKVILSDFDKQFRHARTWSTAMTSFVQTQSGIKP